MFNFDMKMRGILIVVLCVLFCQKEYQKSYNRVCCGMIFLFDKCLFRMYNFNIDLIKNMEFQQVTQISPATSTNRSGTQEIQTSTNERHIESEQKQEI